MASKPKFRMSVKLTHAQRRTLTRLAKKNKCSMTDIIVEGIGYVERVTAVASLKHMDAVPDASVLDALPSVSSVNVGALIDADADAED